VIADRIEGALPEWMLELLHWRDLAITIALGMDALIDGAIEFALAAMPGQNRFAPLLGGFPNTDALPLLGRDRRIVRGFTEGPEDYALRLRHFREAWRAAGTGFGVLEQVRGVLGPNPPRVRAVTASGFWYTIEPDGTRKLHTPDGTGFQIAPDGTSSALTAPAHPFDWDSETHPPNPFRFFIIIYAPTNPPLTGTGGVYGWGLRFYGTPLETLGTSSTIPHVAMIRGLIGDCKTEGVDCHKIIIAFDPDSFDPETPGPYPAAGMPDGWWGHHHGQPVDIGGGHLQRHPARLSTARYWRGT